MNGQKSNGLVSDESGDVSLNLRRIVNWCQDNLADEVLYSRGGVCGQLIKAGVLPQSMATRFVGHFNNWINRANLPLDGDKELITDDDDVPVPAWYGWNLKHAVNTSSGSDE
jgi:hypothetical protein